MRERAKESRSSPRRLAPDDAESEAKRRDEELAATQAGTETEAGGRPGTEEAKKIMMESIGDPEYFLAAEVIYHGSRKAHYDRAHRWAMFIAILSGAGAAISLAPQFFGLIAAAVAAADIAFDLTGGAQAHADIRRRYLELAAELAAGNLETTDFAREWMAISADEPPQCDAAMVVAHQKAHTTLGREYTGIALPRWKRWTSYLWN